VRSQGEPVPASLLQRLQRVVGGTWNTRAAPTATHRRAYDIVSEGLTAYLPKLKTAAEDLKRLEDQAESAGAPWTPGRIPNWPE
jgi:hypothetical protein